jgi:hypothetical protein
LSDIHHLNVLYPYPDGSLYQQGVVMLAIGLMSATAQAIFFTIGLVAFVLGAIGFKLPNERVSLVSLGLAAWIFVLAWNAWALT